MDLKNLKKKFEIDGYVIFKNFFEEDSLNNITKISQEILDRASEGKWRHVRIYRDYPNFFNNLNIFGVDYPLNFDLNKGTFAEFKKLNYKETVLNFLGWKNFNTPLIRLHSNSSFYNYQGEWHRDDSEFPSDNSIQVIIYLLDEKGYRIVPKTKNDMLEKYGILKDQTRTKGRGFAELPKDMYDVIDVKKGDILIHQSGLLHQGFCKKKRMHYHIRHLRDDSAAHDSENILNFEEKFLGKFDITKIKSDSYHDINDEGLKYKLIRYKTFLFYFFPRIKSIFNNLKNKNKESIFHSTIWQ